MIVTSLFGVVFLKKYIRYKLRQYRGVMLWLLCKYQLRKYLPILTFVVMKYD